MRSIIVARLCSWETRDSVTPSTLPISASVKPLEVVQRDDHLVALGKLPHHPQQRRLGLVVLDLLGGRGGEVVGELEVSIVATLVKATLA